MLILATSCFPFRLSLEYVCAGRRSSRGKQTDKGNANIDWYSYRRECEHVGREKERGFCIAQGRKIKQNK